MIDVLNSGLVILIKFIFALIGLFIATRTITFGVLLTHKHFKEAYNGENENPKKKKTRINCETTGGATQERL